MIYIASPYTHPDIAVEEFRYSEALAYTAHLLRNKLWAYSPIVHCHELAKTHKLPTNAEYWLEYNFHVMRLCTDFHILMLPGWKDSKGVKAEIDFHILNLASQAKYIPEDWRKSV